MANRVRDSQRRLRGVVSARLFLFSQTVSAKNLLPMEDYQPIFNDWMTKYSIPISETEYQMRLQIFADTHDLIETHNAGLLSVLFLLSPPFPLFARSYGDLSTWAQSIFSSLTDRIC
jgi:hypothetical protein